MVEGRDFIVVTDHDRSSINMAPQRLESRNRMLSGTSRSYWTADKWRYSASWTMLPSRIASEPVVFDRLTGQRVSGGCSYVVDDASAALDLIDWYNAHPHPFYMYLSYDLGSLSDTLGTYADERLVYFESFGADLKKRGIYDFYDIEMSVEEV